MHRCKRRVCKRKTLSGQSIIILQICYRQFRILRINIKSPYDFSSVKFRVSGMLSFPGKIGKFV